MDLPPPPLYKDELERNLIPQVSLLQLLSKFDGQTVQEMRDSRKRYQLRRLPPYVVFHFKRFLKNNFRDERNPTIVNFPIKNLDLRPCKYLLMLR